MDMYINPNILAGLLTAPVNLSIKEAAGERVVVEMPDGEVLVATVLGRGITRPKFGLWAWKVEEECTPWENVKLLGYHLPFEEDIVICLKDL